jgi:hypothetical protein
MLIHVLELAEDGRTGRRAIQSYSRYVLAWRLSNSLDTDFCLEGLDEALGRGRPEIRPGRAVHEPGVHEATGGGGGSDQHGREGSGPGQRVRGTVVADGEV